MKKLRAELHSSPYPRPESLKWWNWAEAHTIEQATSKLAQLFQRQVPLDDLAVGDTLVISVEEL